MDQEYYTLKRNQNPHRIKAGTRAYYRFLENHPLAGYWVRVGEKVLVVVEERAYLIIR